MMHDAESTSPTYLIYYRDLTNILSELPHTMMYDHSRQTKLPQ